MSSLVEEKNLKDKKEISRKTFFMSVGITAMLGFLASAFPVKFVKSVAKNSNRKHVKVTIHPSAVKRNTKV
jgi:hypothetical protein